MQNRAINVTERYKAATDDIQTGLTIILKSGKQVYAIFEHEKTLPQMITNEEIIKKLRALANHIEVYHNV